MIVINFANGYLIILIKRIIISKLLEYDTTSKWHLSVIAFTGSYYAIKARTSVENRFRSLFWRVRTSDSAQDSLARTSIVIRLSSAPRSETQSRQLDSPERN